MSCKLQKIRSVWCPSTQLYSGNCEDGDVRLMGRNINSEGLLQVCTDEEWFNICNEDWTFSSSEVVCRQLGYESKLIVSLTENVIVLVSHFPSLTSV